MAYTTGTIQDIYELIDAVSEFAGDNGWQIVSDNLGAIFLPKTTRNYNPRYVTENPRNNDNPYSLIASQLSIECGRFPADNESGQPEVSTPCRTLTLKEPVNGMFYYLRAFAPMTGKIAGVSQEVTFLELWCCDRIADTPEEMNLRKLHAAGPYPKEITGYHLFTGKNETNDNLYFSLVLETVPDSFEHLNFGTIEKYWDVPYGDFAQASRQSNGIQTNIWGYAALGNWAPSSYYYFARKEGPLTLGNGYNSDSTVGNEVRNAVILRYALDRGEPREAISLMFSGQAIKENTMGIDGDYAARNRDFLVSPDQLGGMPAFHVAPNGFTGVPLLAPAYVAVYRMEAGRTYQWTLLGHYPNQRMCSIANNQPKDVIMYGDDEWMVFPLHRKGITDVYVINANPVTSGYYAVAYRK